MENEKLEPIGEIKLSEPKRLDQCEWCYQFDEDEPNIFAWTEEEMENENPEVKFVLTNVEGAYILFKDKTTGKSFKLFPRELSEKGKEMRDYQNKAFEQMVNKNNKEENGSENKETEA